MTDKSYADCFVTKLSGDGAAILYSTYYGGNGALEHCDDVAVDAAGNAYTGGLTDSTDLPVVSAFQPSYAGGILDTYVFKLDPTGTTLLYSTYLGGPCEDRARDVAADAEGNAYVAGRVGDNCFFGGISGVLVAKLDPAGDLPQRDHRGEEHHGRAAPRADDEAAAAEAHLPRLRRARGLLRGRMVRRQRAGRLSHRRPRARRPAPRP